MRLKHTDPDASRYEVWLIRPQVPQPLEIIEAVRPYFLAAAEQMLDCRPTVIHMGACVLADEEAGVVEYLLTGPDAPKEFWECGIGYDRPLPPVDELPYGWLTSSLTGKVELRLRS